MLAQTRRNDDGIEYYRLRSFSITPNGIFNLGDSFKSRRSLSINSVNSSESSQTDFSLTQRSRLPSTASQNSTGILEDLNNPVPTFRVAMLGASGVGKTAFTYQFTTSEYICAYDTSLGEFSYNKILDFPYVEHEEQNGTTLLLYLYLT
ncbi:hypothetical protein RUM43_014618 [Polyplax serrata]|uniref:Uncharacterized protein n=1 Tax=Polyplax serrata TaxID=468196 RepID=A0AAN8PGC4_POLSC